MFTTIQELEREIDQFHKNIKDSNELMKILMSVASLTKTQTESFEVHTEALQDELVKLPPELSALFQKKMEDFVQAVQREHQAYQISVTALMERYSKTIEMSESEITKVPEILESQYESTQKRHAEAMEKIEASYSQALTSSMEHFLTQVSSTTEVVSKAPAELDSQLQKDREKNIAVLKEIQEQYATDLARTNEVVFKQLQVMIENIQAVSEQIKGNSEQQYTTFLKELETVMDTHMVQLSNTERQVLDLSQQLQEKYEAFVSKLETTNIDQLYRYCQDMNKSINIKLSIALGGVAIAVIVSIISIFI